MGEQERCMQCGQQLNEAVYAVYKGTGQQTQEDGTDQVAGFLCEGCRGKHKIKGLRNLNELQKLQKLKDMMNSTSS